MIIKLLLFAAAKEIAGTQQLDVALDEPCTVGQLKSALVAEHPELAAMVDRSAFSVCLLYTSPSPRDGLLSRMPSSA